MANSLVLHSNSNATYLRAGRHTALIDKSRTFFSNIYICFLDIQTIPLSQVFIKLLIIKTKETIESNQ